MSTTDSEETHPIMSTFTRRLALASLPLMLFVAACSSGGGASTAPSAAASVAPSEAASEAPSSAPSEAASEAPSAAAGVSLALADSALGQIIVDGEGKTLYMFTPDEAGQPTCYDDCAGAWPPLTADAAPTAGTGLDASKITLVARTDGTQQVKYGDWPLYYFSGDAAAGETNGQGLNEKWYVVGADGQEITGS